VPAGWLGGILGNAQLATFGQNDGDLGGILELASGQLQRPWKCSASDTGPTHHAARGRSASPTDAGRTDYRRRCALGPSGYGARPFDPAGAGYSGPDAKRPHYQQQ